MASRFLKSENITSDPTSHLTPNSNSIGGFAGVLAAGGIAHAALGAGLASLFTTMKALTW